MTHTHSTIGININQDAAYLVELTKLGSTYTVQNYLYTKDLSKIAFINKSVITGLGHQDVYFQQIQLHQKLTSSKIEHFLRLNIEKYLKHPSKDLIFDYTINNSPNKTSGTTIQLVATSNAVIKQHLKLFKQYNIIHKVIDLNVYALERITRRQLSINHNIVATINIDLTQLLIVVINKYKILHTCAEFTENINECELTTKVINILRSIPHKIDQIFLAGQQNIESRILTIITNKLNLEVKIINPFIGMKLPKNIDHKIIPAFAISCGLALRVSDARWN